MTGDGSPISGPSGIERANVPVSVQRSVMLPADRLHLAVLDAAADFEFHGPPSHERIGGLCEQGCRSSTDGQDGRSEHGVALHDGVSGAGAVVSRFVSNWPSKVACLAWQRAYVAGFSRRAVTLAGKAKLNASVVVTSVAEIQNGAPGAM